MSFEYGALHVLGYAYGVTLWVYKTADTPREIGARGYFDGAGDLLREGDWIMVNARAADPEGPSEHRPLVAALLIVYEIGSDGVRVAPLRES